MFVLLRVLTSCDAFSSEPVLATILYHIGLLCFLFSLFVDHMRQVKLSRLVTRSNQRTTRHILEPHVLSHLLKVLKLLWRDILNHRQMLLRRTKVLPKRHNIHIHRTQIPHRLNHLLIRLPQPQHNASLRIQIRRHLLRMLQRPQTLPVTRPSVPDELLQPFHRLDVVRIHVKSRLCQRGDAVVVALEVGDEAFDEERGVGVFEEVDCGGEVGGSSVGDVVAVDGG
mmetsp:Transcript_8476/g.15330  ORF Transcript_8476/g.15330 Transcript_8476/m.15330 type:complete len:226 (+) Transcript_8476:44-721(+)